MSTRTDATPEATARPSLYPAAVVDGVSATEIPFAPEAHWTVPWMLAQRIARSGEAPLVARKSSVTGAWQEVSARSFGQEVARVAAGLVSVPIYETSSAEQVEWILTDARVRMVITESGALAELVRSAAQRADQEVDVLALDSDAITVLIEAGRDIAVAQVEERTEALRVDDLYSIIYTSGTTGRPKGVELTHRNAVGIPYHGVRYLPGVLEGPQVRLLLFLPLAHVYAR